MTIFLLVATGLVLTALAIVTWPLWRRPGNALARDVAAMRRQLQQVRELHGGGALTDDQFAESRFRLERRLIDAVLPPSDGVASGAARGGGSRRLALALALFVLAVTGGGYALVGSPRHLAIGPDRPPPDATAAIDGASDASSPAPHELTAAQIDEMADKLAARLQARPDDAEGWAMLARARVALGQHARAVEAFARAERLLPRDPDLLADYADAVAMAHGRRLEGVPTDLLRRALEIDPHHAKALALAGTAAFDRKDYPAAVTDWETLARIEPPDGPFAGQVGDGLAEARRLAGLAPTPAGAASAATGPGAAAISGTITLAPALAGRAAPDDALFVFARAVDGPRMPVAVVRKRVKDLPLDFTLDDSMAMSPAARLSSVRRVIVGARISHSGNAVPQAGDLQGASPPVDVGASALRVEIDQAVAN